MEALQKVVDTAHRTEINDLPDDVIVDILSRLSRTNHGEVVRTSILSRRWRYLPSFVCSSSLPVTLVLDDRDLSRAKFIELVGRVLKLHRDASLEGLIVRAFWLERSVVNPWTRPEDIKPGDVEKLVYVAVRKRVKVFELEYDSKHSEHKYEFPDLKTMPSDFLGVKSFAFVSLTFVGVNIGDEVIHKILEKCHHLEKLCIRRCTCIQDLKVVGARLKVLEISYAHRIQLFVPSLVACTYGGNKVFIPLKNNPNLRELELSLGGDIACSFVADPLEHASYSHQLVKLELNFLKKFRYYSPVWFQRPGLPRLCSLKHLELNLVLLVGKSIHIFIKLINGSPLLKELRIKISYMVRNPRSAEQLGFPGEAPSSKLDSHGRHRHKNLKVFKMSGYVGCANDDKFVLWLLYVAQSLKTVAIDTESEYYDQKPWDCATQCPNEGKGLCGYCSKIDIGARTRVEAKRRANQLKLSFPLQTKAVLIVT